MKTLNVLLVGALLTLLAFPQVFASGIEVTGKILDQSNRPIPGGVVVVTNTSGKAVVAVKADPSGEYRFSVPSGTYSLTVTAPSGVNLGSQTISNEKITSSTTLNFMLQVPMPPVASKSMQIFTWSPYVIGILLLVIIVVEIYFWQRRKKSYEELPQTSSPH